MTYNVVLRSEEGEGLDGYVILYDATGEAIGEIGINRYGVEIYDSDIPAGTVSYRFYSPGYHWYGTSELGSSNTITLVKEISVAKYVLFGVLGAGALWLLTRFIKF